MPTNVTDIYPSGFSPLKTSEFASVSQGGTFAVSDANSIVNVYSRDGFLNDSNTVLFVQSDTVNGDTAFFDTSAGGVTHTITTNGSAVHSDVQAKFEDTSIYLDGGGGYLSTPSHPELVDWMSGDGFTFECWMFANDFNVTSNGGANILSQSDPTGSSEFFSFGTIDTGAVRFYYYSGAARYVTSTSTVALGTWNHIALVRFLGSIYLYINGVLDATDAVVGTPSISTNDVNNPFLIGRSTTLSFNGYLDKVSISNGVARYTEDFIPPDNDWRLMTPNLDWDMTDVIVEHPKQLLATFPQGQTIRRLKSGTADMGVVYI